MDHHSNPRSPDSGDTYITPEAAAKDSTATEPDTTYMNLPPTRPVPPPKPQIYMDMQRGSGVAPPQKRSMSTWVNDPDNSTYQTIPFDQTTQSLTDRQTDQTQRHHKVQTMDYESVEHGLLRPHHPPQGQTSSLLIRASTDPKQVQETDSYRLTIMTSSLDGMAEIYYKMPANKVRFLFDHAPEQIDRLKRQVQFSPKMEILPSIRTDEPGLDIKCLQIDAGQILGQMALLVPQILEEEKLITNKGLGRYLLSEYGRLEIQRYERDRKLFIAVEELVDDDCDEDQTAAAAAGDTRLQGDCNIFKTTEGLSIQLVIGSIDTIKSDVIITSVSKFGDLSLGRVSQLLVKAGGSSIEKEFKRMSSNLQSWDLVETSSGKLKKKCQCDRIYYITCPEWGGHGSQSEQVLRTLITKCLSRANADGKSSISFPAVGTGKLKFPPTTFSGIIVEEIIKFSSTVPDTSVQTVNIVVFNQDQKIIRAMKDELAARRSGHQIPVSGVSCRRSLTFPCSFHTPEGIELKIVKGSIVAQQVDVLVNTTSLSLDLNSGAVSKLILNKAGQSIQDECKRQKPNGIKYGEIAVTPGGQLPCQYIYHGACPAWRNGKEELIMLGDLLRSCVSRAHLDEMVTIAMPAIGTGTLNYPPADVIETIMQVLLQFSNETQFSTIKEICVVVFEDKILQQMKDHLEQNIDDLWPSPNPTAASGDSVADDPCTPLIEGDVRLQIYGLDKPVLSGTITDIESHYTSHSKALHFDRKQILERLPDLTGIKLLQLSSTIKDCGVYVKTNWSKGNEYLHLEGYNQAVDSAVQKLSKSFAEMNVKGSLVQNHLPPDWESMQPHQSISLVPILDTSDEYKVVKRLFEVTAKKRIVGIERVQNPTLYAQYLMYKEEMAKTAVRSLERTLYHGTTHSSLGNINLRGFNRSYYGKHATAYGQGVYFARDAQYSCRDKYSTPDDKGRRYIYQCRVLTGRYILGDEETKEPPMYSATERYHSTVDDMKKPKIFVIYNDTQAYPEYLITFKT